MRYLFFDIECANCFDGKGKICSFGYVLTDENFTVLKKEDWVMNPRARFYLTSRKSGEDIELFYTKSQFRHAPTFPHFYEAIRALLCAPDQIVIGHAVANDVKFICDECERYALPHFPYAFFDSQKIFCQYKEVKNQVALDKIIAEFGLEPATLHKSDDDALMTMWATRALCRVHECDLPTLIERYPTCSGSVIGGKITLQDAKRYNNQEDNRLHNGNLRIFLGYLRAVKPQVTEPIQSPLNGQKVFFPHAYESCHFRQMVYFVQALANHGAVYCHNSRLATLRVKLDDAAPSHAEANAHNILLFSELLQILDIDGEWLERGEIDVDTMFSQVGAQRVTIRRRKRKKVAKKPQKEVAPTLPT
jgi:DNA polymerase III epsilon subunit-like protein